MTLNLKKVEFFLLNTSRVDGFFKTRDYLKCTNSYESIQYYNQVFICNFLSRKDQVFIYMQYIDPSQFSLIPVFPQETVLPEYLDIPRNSTKSQNMLYKIGNGNKTDNEERDSHSVHNYNVKNKAYSTNKLNSSSDYYGVYKVDLVNLVDKEPEKVKLQIMADLN